MIRVKLHQVRVEVVVTPIYENVNRPSQGHMTCQHLYVAPWKTDCTCGQDAHVSHHWNAVCVNCTALMTVEGL